MGIKSDRTVYQMVEERLRKADKPMTCNELMDFNDIRQEMLNEFGDVTTATNKLSDRLGFMWRRGVLTRYPAPRTSTSFARYAYGLTAVPEEPPLKAVPPPIKLKTKSLLGVTEHDDCVEIEFEKFIIYVKPKK